MRFPIRPNHPDVARGPDRQGPVPAIAARTRQSNVPDDPSRSSLQDDDVISPDEVPRRDRADETSVRADRYPVTQAGVRLAGNEIRRRCHRGIPSGLGGSWRDIGNVIVREDHRYPGLGGRWNRSSRPRRTYVPYPWDRNQGNDGRHPECHRQGSNEPPWLSLLA